MVQDISILCYEVSAYWIQYASLSSDELTQRDIDHRAAIYLESGINLVLFVNILNRTYLYYDYHWFTEECEQTFQSQSKSSR
jgi:hypothetical protein